MKSSICTIIFLVSVFTVNICFGGDTVAAPKNTINNIENKSINCNTAEPGIYDYVLVDKEPYVDLKRLASLVEYPEMAIKAGVEGKVVVRALIDSLGIIKKIAIEYTDNVMFNDAAKNAVKKYHKFEPAIFNGKRIACWVSIPIQFSLSVNVKSIFMTIIAKLCGF